MALPISIITPCYNAAATLEQTLRSVLTQNYADVQYIVVDGGSTDKSLELLEAYSPQIDRIISEPDQGPYDAIRKGAAYAEGEILAWLNADDTYHPGAFKLVAQLFEQFPDLQWIIGVPSYLNAQGDPCRISGNVAPAYPQRFIQNGWFREGLMGYLQQESMFWRRSLWDKVGGLNLDYTLAADFDLWTRFAAHTPLVSLAVPLASFRLNRSTQRSATLYDRYLAEVASICADKPMAPRFWRLLGGHRASTNALLRCLVWKQSNVIGYHPSLETWQLKQMRRPVSRASFLELLYEWKLRR